MQKMSHLIQFKIGKDHMTATERLLRKLARHVACIVCRSHDITRKRTVHSTPKHTRERTLDVNIGKING